MFLRIPQATEGRWYQPVALPKSYTVKVLSCLRTSWNHKSLIKCDGDFDIHSVMMEIVLLAEPVFGRSLWWCFGKLGCLHHFAKRVFKPTTVIRKTLMFLENTTGHCWPVVTFYCQESKPWKLWISRQFPKNHINFMKLWLRLNHLFCNDGGLSELSNEFWDVCHVIALLSWGVYIVVAWTYLKLPSKFVKLRISWEYCRPL